MYWSFARGDKQGLESIYYDTDVCGRQDTMYYEMYLALLRKFISGNHINHKVTAEIDPLSKVVSAMISVQVFFFFFFLGGGGVRTRRVCGTLNSDNIYLMTVNISLRTMFTIHVDID